ncbi:hypothetical protein FHG87_018583 [Trinorchestia longiramus]|nr:hypothetical protein FHG87_018583 [Trinorchestia longiramus]
MVFPCPSSRLTCHSLSTVRGAQGCVIEYRPAGVTYSPDPTELRPGRGIRSMACWASVLCRRTLRHRLGNGCRQSSSKQGLEALSFAEKSSLKRPSTSRWILKPLSHSCHHPRDVLRSGGSKQNTCDGASQGKEVCCCCCTAFSCFKIEPSNTDNNLGIVANSSILSSRHKSRKLEHEDHCEDTHLRKPKVPYCEHTPTCFTPLFFPLHLLNWTKTFSCASHFYIPKATQISRFSSQPSKDPVTQNAPKDNPGATGPTGLLPPPTRSALSLEPRPKGIVGYIISRYTWYIERLQHSLESEMPRTFRMFRIFSVGLKTFIKDFTGYVRVLVKLSFPSERLENLTLHQLQLYHFMPYDMFKIVETMSYNADVASFMETLGPFYEYVDVTSKSVGPSPGSHDTGAEDLQFQGSEQQLCLQTPLISDRTDESADSAVSLEYEVPEKLNMVGLNGIHSTNGIIHEIVECSDQVHKLKGSLKNGGLCNGDVKRNGVVSRGVFPHSVADEARDSAAVTAAATGSADNENVFRADRPPVASDTDSEEEYAVPPEVRSWQVLFLR